MILYVWHHPNEIEIAIETPFTRFPQPVGNLLTAAIFSISLRSKGLPRTNSPSPLAIIDLSSCTTAGAVSQLRALDIRHGVKFAFPPCRDALHFPNLGELSLVSKLDKDINDIFGMFSNINVEAGHERAKHRSLRAPTSQNTHPTASHAPRAFLMWSRLCQSPL